MPHPPAKASSTTAAATAFVAAPAAKATLAVKAPPPREERAMSACKTMSKTIMPPPPPPKRAAQATQAVQEGDADAATASSSSSSSSQQASATNSALDVVLSVEEENAIVEALGRALDEEQTVPDVEREDKDTGNQQSEARPAESAHEGQAGVLVEVNLNKEEAADSPPETQTENVDRKEEVPEVPAQVEMADAEIGERKEEGQVEVEKGKEMEIEIEREQNAKTTQAAAEVEAESLTVDGFSPEFWWKLPEEKIRRLEDDYYIAAIEAGKRHPSLPAFWATVMKELEGLEEDEIPDGFGDDVKGDPIEDLIAFAKWICKENNYKPQTLQPMDIDNDTKMDDDADVEMDEKKDVDAKDMDTGVAGKPGTPGYYMSKLSQA